MHKIVRTAKKILFLPAHIFRWVIRAKYKLLLVSFIIFVVLVALSLGAYHYWSSPEFCKSCHIMQPYYQSWKTSSHNFVRCVECHFEPGLAQELRGKWVAVKQLASYITGAYSPKPYAEISDASCLRSGCHQERLVKGKILFTKRKVLFDHTPHLTQMRHGIKLTCTSCHSQIVIGSHEQVTHSTCFLCHFKGGIKRGIRDNPIGGCGICHGPPEAIIQVGAYKGEHKKFTALNMDCTSCHIDVTYGEGEVTQERCYHCHNQPEKLEKFSQVELIHISHITMRKIECGRCHNPIEHRFNTSLVEKQYQDCSSCHESKHIPQSQFYAGKGGRGHEGRPDPMHLVGISCSGCHTMPKHGREAVELHGQTYVSGHLPCISCHGNRYTQFVDTFHSDLHDMMNFLQKRWQSLSVLVDTPDKIKALPQGYKIYSLIQDCKYNLEFVRIAKGIHNPFYAVELLKWCDATLEEAEKLAGIKTEDSKPPGFTASNCMLCHRSLPQPGVIEIDKERRFPHQRHTVDESLECITCHKGTHPPRSRTDEKFCGVCH